MNISLVSAFVVRGGLSEVIAKYNETSGNKVIGDFKDAGPVVKKRIEGGEQFDIVVLAKKMMDDLATKVELQPTSRVGIARTGVGIAVKLGAKPLDLSNTEAFKRTLLTAKAIGMTNPAAGGAASVYCAGLIKQLGLEDQLKPKLKLYEIGKFPHPLIDGEVDLFLFQSSEILQDKEVGYGGSLPAEIQQYSEYVAGVSAKTESKTGIDDFLKYVRTPEAQQILQKWGLETPA